MLEETGPAAEGRLPFAGFAGFILAPDQRAECSALFTGQAADGTRRFTPDAEIEAVRW
ncbi:hypothetical protein ACIRJO_16970 [Streptomyces sp. NPDC102394]|uniref:hypothetical protein n=1 Tax=Streptomyces sp. NPDC102394 TaxID=3366167 RepID=UPI00380DB93C